MPIHDANEEQKQAITHGDGPLLIVAGAGTGKTRVITERIAWLILEEKANIHELLALTFTEKASMEMEERVDKLLPYGYVDLWISTFHSFCDKILKAHALDIGLSNNFRLLNQTQAWLMVRESFKKFDLDYYRPLGNPTKFIHALLNHFSRCKDENISAREYLEYCERLKTDSARPSIVEMLDIDDLDTSEQDELIESEIKRVSEVANAYKTYQQLLLDNNALDFADLLNYTVKLFKERPLVLRKYQKQFKYVLVDEFQDTNFVQYELIKLLSAPNNNLTVVGDDDQSIYRFRGSSITNIMRFKDDFPDAKEIVLVDNYRSGQDILDKSHAFIKQNDPNRLEVKLDINKKLTAQSGLTASIEHLHFDHVENEGRGVVNKILELKNDNPDKKWSDFAILVRANDSANMFVKLLGQAKVPYQFMALKGLYQKPVIINFYNYFKVLENFHDNSAVFRVLNLPFLKTNPQAIAKLVHFAKRKSLSLYEVARQAAAVDGIGSESVQKIAKIVSQIEKDTLKAQEKNVTEVFLSFLYDSGYLEFLKNLPEAESREQIGYLQQFFQKVQEYETSQDDKTLGSFMAMLSMELEAGEAGSVKFDVEDSTPESVKVMTIHSSKGLEFPYVFIVNMVNRKFPTDKRSEPIKIPVELMKDKVQEGDFHLEEERRLFYVAMTRAKEKLYLTSAEDYGGVRMKKLSRFLIELGFEQPEPMPKVENTEKLEQSGEESVPEVIHIPKRFSFSALSQFDRCSYQYYFARVLKIPTYGKPALTFGDVIHRTLNDFLSNSFDLRSTQQGDLFSNDQNSEEANEQRLLPFEQLLAQYQRNWIDDWYESAEQKQAYFEKGQNILKSFYDGFQKEQPTVKMLEQPFTLKLKGYSLIGRIDRVDDVEGGVEIIDYKTGTVKNDKLSAGDKKQLILYHIAAEESLGLKPVKLSFYYLEGDKKISFVAKDKDIEKLKLEFLDGIKKIQAGNFDPKPSQFACGFCDFKDICDFRKI